MSQLFIEYLMTEILYFIQDYVCISLSNINKGFRFILFYLFIIFLGVENICSRVAHNINVTLCIQPFMHQYYFTYKTVH